MGDYFPFRIEDVAALLGVGRIRGNKLLMPCPACGSSDAFDISLEKQRGYCFKCGAKINAVTLYATLQDVDNKTAHREILDRLGINKGKYDPPKFIQVEKDNLASLDVRDKTYHRMLALLSLDEAHKRDLAERGLRHCRYKTLDLDYYGRKELASDLLRSGCTLAGVPGFYRDEKGDWMLVKHQRGILVPYNSYDNKIQGLQIRRDNAALDKNGKKRSKYVWLSSKVIPEGCMDGTRSRTFIHYATEFYYEGGDREEPFVPKNHIYLTEGAMKADIFHQATGLPCIAVPGVNAISQLTGELTRLKQNQKLKMVRCVYDMDYLTNTNVFEAVGKAETLVKNMNLFWDRPKWNTHSCLKGIDDYVVYRKYGIVPKGHVYITDYDEPAL